MSKPVKLSYFCENSAVILTSFSVEFRLRSAEESNTHVYNMTVAD